MGDICRVLQPTVNFSISKKCNLKIRIKWFSNNPVSKSKRFSGHFRLKYKISLIACKHRWRGEIWILHLQHKVCATTIEDWRLWKDGIALTMHQCVLKALGNAMPLPRQTTIYQTPCLHQLCQFRYHTRLPLLGVPCQCRKRQFTGSGFSSYLCQTPPASTCTPAKHLQHIGKIFELGCSFGNLFWEIVKQIKIVLHSTTH